MKGLIPHRSTGKGFWLDKESEKKLGYFEIEHIDDPCILTIACNPKDYFEMFEDTNINKKHKGIKKGFSGLCFENFLTE